MTGDRTAMADHDTRGHWTAGLLAAVLLGVEAVIVAESWRGLTGFAHLIGITGPWAWGVPVTLDGVSLVAALTALRAELAGEASGVYRLTLFGFTGASAAANWWHAKHAAGTEAALYLGGMSLAVAWVFALALRQIRNEDRRRAGTVTARLPRFSAAHWGRYPALTWRAWSLAIRDGHTSPRSALDAALGHGAGAEPAPGTGMPGAGLVPVPAGAETAAAAALAASIAGGNGLSQNQLMTRFRLTRGQATKVRRAVLAESNGRGGLSHAEQH